MLLLSMANMISYFWCAATSFLSRAADVVASICNSATFPYPFRV